MCYEFTKTGKCRFGDCCKFSHALSDKQKEKQQQRQQKAQKGDGTTPKEDKKVVIKPLCISIENGIECPHGSKCRFRHTAA